MIPVLGFATVKRFDLAQRLLDSIDYPIRDLVIVNNSGTREFEPSVDKKLVRNLWHLEVPRGLGGNGAWNLIIKSTPHAPYWILPNDDCYFPKGSLETIAKKVDTTKFNFPNVKPSKWSCAIPGEGAIEKAGLWDEYFHPIYYDDNEYERRLGKAGVEINFIGAIVNHEHSATLHSGYSKLNEKTFHANARALDAKIKNQDFSVWGWDLKRRRAQSWD